MTCASCGTDNPTGRKFCRECGERLAVVCAACGTANPPGDKFCGECGAALAAVDGRWEGRSAAGPIDRRGHGPAAMPASEIRLVSVLFADLVGFTPLSESRDPDEVRDLLTRYFETASQVISRYGGSVEKFIGDAVMAVWGTPSAREDDAERSVRAALDLVQAVERLGEDLEVTGLLARAGVMTGEVAVSIGAVGQGMVAGDLVNTASRVQGLAEPGTVLTDDATRRATESAVAFEPAGAHEVKGKAEPIALYRATRVIGGRGGALRSVGLEAPFVGRDRELRILKDLFHMCVDQRKAHLLNVMGIAGIGKSRLAWEFYKYFDGLVDVYLWHRGRCLAYGDGVTYWALAEMVRGRCGILEGEDPATAREKLRTTTAEYLEPDERPWVESRLAHLIGVAPETSGEPEDLFSAWRLFFERLARRHPVIMVFADVQWADPSLLEFIDSLVNWSRGHPLFVMVLGRPELAERHPDWALPRRGTTALHLEPLSDGDLRALLSGLVPGLPDALERQIVERAEGVPLYAVETVRMLLDRGILRSDGAAYRLTGTVDRLEVPETLHALIAARLDGLDPRERAALQSAAVLGKTFTTAALSGLTGFGEHDLGPLLTSLVRKEVLFVQADARSPELGQYGFLQDLARRVAYETLSKRERKARHLAAAAHLEAAWGGDDLEIVEIVASHYLEALRLAPTAPDATDITAKARSALTRAGERSQSLAAPHLAQRYYEQAIELTEDPDTLAGLHEQAGLAAYRAGRTVQASSHYEQAMAAFEREGRSRDAARVSARFGDLAWQDGRLEEAGARMESAFQVLSSGDPDETLATVAAHLARMLLFTGNPEGAFDRNEVALDLAERLDLHEVLSHALNTKAVMLFYRGRREESQPLLWRALDVALRHDHQAAALRAYINLVSTSSQLERWDEVSSLIDRGAELARKAADRTADATFTLARLEALITTGRWDEALAIAEEFERTSEGFVDLHFLPDLLNPIVIHARRGNLAAAHGVLNRYAHLEKTEEVQTRAAFGSAHAVLARAEGRFEDAVLHAERALTTKDVLGIHSCKDALVEGVEAALALSGAGRAEDLLGHLERLLPGELTPSMRGQRDRLRAKLDAMRGNQVEVERRLDEAIAEFRAIPAPFWLGVTLLERAEWLGERGRHDEAGGSLSEAVDIFEMLGARPMLERAWAQRAAIQGPRLPPEPAALDPRPAR